MQMHFRLTPHYFSASGLPKANVFVSKRGGCWQGEWQELQPVSSPCQQQTVIPSSLALAGRFHPPLDQPRRKNLLFFYIPESDSGTSPNAQQNYAGYLEGSFHCRLSTLWLSSHSCTKTLLPASQGDLTNPRDQRVQPLTQNSWNSQNNRNFQCTAHCVQVLLCGIWMACHHFFFGKDPVGQNNTHASFVPPSPLQVLF